MAKITEYPEAQSFDQGDVILKDGTNGTKKMTVENLMNNLVPPVDATLTQTGKPADAKKVGDEITDLKSAFDQLLTKETADNWEKGNFNSITGANNSIDNFIRNQNFYGIFNGTTRIEVPNGYLMLLFAWELDDTFVGSYKTTGIFDKTTSNFGLISSFECADFPDYKIKISFRREPTSSEIDISEGQNCALYFQTDKTLSIEGKAADAKATGASIASVQTQVEAQSELFLANTQTTINSEAITLEWIEGSYYDLSTGIVTPLATYARTEKMPCKAGDTFIIEPSAGQIVWFKADGSVSYSGTNSTALVYRVAPVNTIYFALNNNNTSIRASSLVFKSVDNDLIKMRVVAPAKLLCDISAFTSGKYASTSDGAIADVETFKCLMHYPVKANHKYRTAHQTQVVFYTSGLVFISSLLPGGAARNTGTAVEMDFTTPNNCAFICVNTNKSFEMLFDVDEYDITGFVSNPSKLLNKTVLSFGDSITGNYAFGDNIIYEVERFCGAKTYNAGFGGCRMEKINESGSAAEVAALTNPFAMCELVDQLALPDSDPTKWAAQDTAAADFEAAPRYNRIIKFRLGILKEVDISKIDIVTIAYGTNEAGYAQDDEQNPYNKYTYAGATRYSLEKLLEINPKLRIVLLAPIYRHSFGAGTTGDSDSYVNASTGLGLLDNINTLKAVGAEYKIPVIDLYHDLGINKDNYTAYFGDDDEPDDGTHINTYGREEYGRRLAGELSRLM